MNPFDDPNLDAIEFPIDFPLKVMGRNDGQFAQHVKDLLRPHLGDIADSAFASRPSKNGKFIALTITFQAKSREQLDAIYRSVTSSSEVLYTL